MTDILLSRKWVTTESTIGELTFLDFSCKTLEDRWRKPGSLKVYGETCIPAGRYKVIMFPSKHFKRIMPRLLNVPDFTDILIHWGNFITDTRGCILVGTSSGKDMVYASKEAFNILLPIIEKALEEGDLYITITDDFDKEAKDA